MKSLGWMNLVVVLFLFAVIHEGSAEPNKYLKIIFRARQAEARRNRLKYRPFKQGEEKKKDIFTGFLLTGDFEEFVWPKLSNDGALQQTFRKDGNNYYLSCRKGEQSDIWTSQKSAIEYLKFGKPFYYSPIQKGPRTGRLEDTFVFTPTPLSEYEKEFYAGEQHRFNFCGNTPMPGLKWHTKYNRYRRKYEVVKYSYGESAGKFQCAHLEFGVENIPGKVQGDETFNKTVKDGKWASLAHFCYDKKRFVTAFTKHTIEAAFLENRKLNPNLDTSYDEKVFVDKDIEKIYDLGNQERSLIWKQKEFPKELETFSTITNYFVRAHLIPDHDMLYESWQFLTQNSINYAPMWRSVNHGQWLKVEQDIRHMATKLKQTLTIYTGVYYPSKKENALYLINRKQFEDDPSKLKPTKSLPIPSLFYKYVFTEQSGIVLITANGVSGSLDEINCRDICHQYGWLFTDSEYIHRNRQEFGATKCCLPIEFFNQPNFDQFIPELPLGKKTQIRKILTYGGKEIDVLPYKAATQTPAVNQAEPSRSGTDTMVWGNERAKPGITAAYLIGGDLDF